MRSRSARRQDAERSLRHLGAWLVAEYGAECAERALPGTLARLEVRCAAPEAGRVRYTLPSGAVADFRPGTGRLLRLAGRLVGEDADPICYEYALIAVRALLDGQPVSVEQIETMSDDDVAQLLGALRGKVPSDAVRLRGSAEEMPFAEPVQGWTWLSAPPVRHWGARFRKRVSEAFRGSR